MAYGRDSCTNASVTLTTDASPTYWSGSCVHAVVIENQRHGNLHQVQSHSYDPTNQILFDNAQDFVVVHGLVRSGGLSRKQSTVTTGGAIGQSIEVYTAGEFFDATQKLISRDGKYLTFWGSKELVSNKYDTTTG